MNDAKLHYSNAIEGICGREKPFLSSYLLLKEHLRVKDEAVKQFLGQDNQKMGGKDFSEKYQMDLEQVVFLYKLLCEKEFCIFKKHSGNFCTVSAVPVSEREQETIDCF